MRGRNDEAYENCISYRTCAILELSVEEIAEAGVLREVLRVDLFQVAAENPGVNAKTDRADPYGQLEGVEIAPYTRQVPQR